MDLDYSSLARQIFDPVPFLNLIGVQIDVATPDRAVVSFESRPDLIGNHHQQILHGGVISTVMDSAGGLVAILKYIESAEIDSPEEHEEAKRRIKKFATIDMRSDFLSPGRGNRFVCEASVYRLGRHVIVSRMEFRNEDDVLIAVGTGTYNY